MQAKKKRGSTNLWLFLFLWVLGYMLSWGLTIAINQVIARQFPYGWQNNINPLLPIAQTGQIVLSGGLGAIPLIPIIFWQKFLLRRQLHHVPRYWYRGSYLALLISVVCLQLVAQSLDNSRLNYEQQAQQFPLAAQIAVLVMCPVVVQWWLLRREAPQAWLWILANLVGCLLFAIPLNTYSLYTLYYQPTAFAIAGVLQSLVTGVALFWALTHSPQPTPR